MKQAFIDRFGNPDADGDGILDPAWFKRCIGVYELPFPMRLSWPPYTPIRRFQAHNLAAAQIIAAMERMRAYRGEEYLHEMGLDQWGGCFNFRLIRGGEELSIHSWGAAVDINPQIGRLGDADDARNYPRFIVQSFEAEGFVWGGRWARPDAMHFELTA